MHQDPANGQLIPAYQTTSLESRLQEGRATRSRISRADHRQTEFHKRNFDVVETILSGPGVPAILPVKFAHMATSLFAYFRRTANVMAADLGRLPHTGIAVRLCGDAHLQNLGSNRTSSDELVFELNDFDETIRGPWEWDVKRAATSIAVAATELGERDSVKTKSIEIFIGRYLDTIGTFARDPVLFVADYQIRRSRAPVPRAFAESERATPRDLLAKLTDVHRRETKFNVRPLFWRVGGNERAELLECLERYRKTLPAEGLNLFRLFRPVDAAFKVIGTGSVGLREHVVLLNGNGATDALFLQIKQTVASTYSPFAQDAKYENQGQRVAEGQRSIQARPNLLVGWTRITNDDYVVRPLSDHKGSLSLESLRRGGLRSIAEVFGELLARGHARSGDAAMIHGYCGSKNSKIVRPLRDFAIAYSQQVVADYATFIAAVKKGRVKVARPA